MTRSSLIFLFIFIQIAQARYMYVSCGHDEECIDIYQCPMFSQLLQRSPKPRPPSVINKIREKQCDLIDRKIPKVCCNVPQTTSPPSSSSTTDPTVETSRPTKHPNYDKLPNDICGPITMNPGFRITSGSKTFLGEFPWMALLIYYQNGIFDFRCGGSLISERYVLTAAHCITDTLAGIRLGEYDTGKVQDCEHGTCAPSVQDFYIESYKVHEEYNSSTFANDIALIKLATPAEFNVNVKPICLPVDFPETDLAGEGAIVSGWGVTEHGTKSSKLLKATIPVRLVQECQSKYQRFAEVTDKQVCAGGADGQDSCGGDSGGPMKYIAFLIGMPRYIQYGIVSYGPSQCGTPGQPAIYTRVGKYIDWILDNID